MPKNLIIHIGQEGGRVILYTSAFLLLKAGQLAWRGITSGPGRMALMSGTILGGGALARKSSSEALFMLSAIVGYSIWDHRPLAYVFRGIDALTFGWLNVGVGMAYDKAIIFIPEFAASTLKEYITTPLKIVDWVVWWVVSQWITNPIRENLQNLDKMSYQYGYTIQSNTRNKLHALELYNLDIVEVDVGPRVLLPIRDFVLQKLRLVLPAATAQAIADKTQSIVEMHMKLSQILSWQPTIVGWGLSYLNSAIEGVLGVDVIGKPWMQHFVTNHRTIGAMLGSSGAVVSRIGWTVQHFLRYTTVAVPAISIAMTVSSAAVAIVSQVKVSENWFSFKNTQYDQAVQAITQAETALATKVSALRTKSEDQVIPQAVRDELSRVLGLYTRANLKIGAEVKEFVKFNDKQNIDYLCAFAIKVLTRLDMLQVGNPAVPLLPLQKAQYAHMLMMMTVLDPTQFGHYLNDCVNSLSGVNNNQPTVSPATLRMSRSLNMILAGCGLRDSTNPTLPIYFPFTQQQYQNANVNLAVLSASGGQVDRIHKIGHTENTYAALIATALNNIFTVQPNLNRIKEIIFSTTPQQGAGLGGMAGLLGM